MPRAEASSVGAEDHNSNRGIAGKEIKFLLNGRDHLE